MEFARAMLFASASTLGLLLYVVSALLATLALVSMLRDGASPVQAGLAALVSFAVGLGCRYFAKRLA